MSWFLIQCRLLVENVFQLVVCFGMFHRIGQVLIPPGMGSERGVGVESSGGSKSLSLIHI